MAHAAASRDFKKGLGKAIATGAARF